MSILFIKFSNNRSILLEVYLNNCIVRDLNQRIIIIIIYDKSIFFVNNSCWKVYILNRYDILLLKRKRKKKYNIRFFIIMLLTLSLFFFYEIIRRAS